MSRQTPSERALTYEDKPIVPVNFHFLPEATLQSYLVTLKHVLKNMLREHATLPGPRFGPLFGRWYRMNDWILITRLEIGSLEKYLRNKRKRRKPRRARRG